MGDIIFNIIWYVLAIWTCLAPHGYGPYVMLGFNIGDFAGTLYCGVQNGCLREEGDFDFTSFLMALFGFVLLGGFYLGGLSFQPGSDAYNIAVYVIFVVFLLSFVYRFLQYNLGRLL